MSEIEKLKSRARILFSAASNLLFISVVLIAGSIASGKDILFFLGLCSTAFGIFIGIYADCLAARLSKMTRRQYDDQQSK